MQFQKWPNIIFWTGKKFKTARNAISRKSFLINLISEVFLPRHFWFSGRLCNAEFILLTHMNSGHDIDLLTLSLSLDATICFVKPNCKSNHTSLLYTIVVYIYCYLHMWAVCTCEPNITNLDAYLILIVRFFFILGIESFIFWLLDLTRNLS